MIIYHAKRRLYKTSRQNLFPYRMQLSRVALKYGFVYEDDDVAHHLHRYKCKTSNTNIRNNPFG